MIPNFGPLELIIILVIVAMLFGVGKLPEVFGAVGKGVREFRTNAQGDSEKASANAKAETAQNGTGPVVTTAEAEPVKATETTQAT